ncbi:5-formyltetrahydrofolate cyclo-ligase [Catalinimonas alkaloidigena]|uniref:5-formyltetrahydrofolate cyclo-ligase n=1 Tax=Catalinimonas alkaloidigena TaxID=1075417 RepID=UPI00240571E7|nr:5-formyltetrahydrofolate cyclo-ligase [Catalinimonas alkaloidigena]MDF9800745.1 5-formyltetrahydrofolate cyclo-ligase [Catalinimonas alkaloidigena]
MTKTEARTYFRRQRKQLSQDEYQLANQKLYEQAITFLGNVKPLAVHCFLPILKNKEVNTWPIIAWLHEHNIQVVVPKSSLEDNSMQHFQLSQEVECVENTWGIPEPQGQSLVLVAEREISVVLVPLLAFDQRGNRVGYGKGYYDAFLSKCLPETLKVGLSLFPPLTAISGLNPLDVKLSHAITPDKVWDFADSGTKNQE